MRFTYPARLRPDSTGELIVSFRDLPDCLSSGSNQAHALAQASDALEKAIAARINRSGHIPVPSPCGAGEHPVAVPLETALKAALAIALHETGTSQKEFAGLLGIDDNAVHRMLLPEHRLFTGPVQIAFRALGRELVVESLPADYEATEDRAALAAGRARGLAGTVPIEVIHAKRAGAHPLKAWRTARGLTLEELAASSGVGKAHISHIENRRRDGTVDVLRRLAAALDCTLDDLVA